MPPPVWLASWAMRTFQRAGTTMHPFGTPTALVTAAFIRPEEKRLEAEFGEEFRAYRSRVRRWL